MRRSSRRSKSSTRSPPAADAASASSARAAGRRIEPMPQILRIPIRPAPAVREHDLAERLAAHRSEPTHRPADIRRCRTCCGRRAPGGPANGRHRDLGMAVKVFGDAVAHRVRRIPEQPGQRFEALPTSAASQRAKAVVTTKRTLGRLISGASGLAVGRLGAGDAAAFQRARDAQRIALMPGRRDDLHPDRQPARRTQRHRDDR